MPDHFAYAMKDNRGAKMKESLVRGATRFISVRVASRLLGANG
jgi:hypothetical protein